MPAVPALLIVYVVLALMVGFAGRNRMVGFAGFFILSLVLTPIITALIVLLGSPKTEY
ncbi:MAG: hypothetical protein AB8B57_08040 [Congregibacter sp.]